MTKTQDYPFIRWWGRRLGSYPYYINDQVERARATGAPQTAIYEETAPGGGGTGKWRTIHDITAPISLRQLFHEFGDDVLERYAVKS